MRHSSSILPPHSIADALSLSLSLPLSVSILYSLHGQLEPRQNSFGAKRLQRQECFEPSLPLSFWLHRACHPGDTSAESWTRQVLLPTVIPEYLPYAQGYTGLPLCRKRVRRVTTALFCLMNASELTEHSHVPVNRSHRNFRSFQ